MMCLLHPIGDGDLGGTLSAPRLLEVTGVQLSPASGSTGSLLLASLPSSFSGWMSGLPTSGLPTGGQSWGGQSWVHQSSGLPTPTIMLFYELFVLDMGPGWMLGTQPVYSLTICWRKKKFMWFEETLKKQLQPVWFYVQPGRRFEETFEITLWRKFKQM